MGREFFVVDFFALLFVDDDFFFSQMRQMRLGIVLFYILYLICKVSNV